jgi:uncharacterized protein
MRPVLLVPGYTNAGPAHWMSLWERALPQALRVEQEGWDAPEREGWVARLDEAVVRAETPPVLVAHSLGCLAVAHWAARHRRAVSAAMLVAPPDPERPDALEALRGFAPIPRAPLPFSSILVASTDDPYADPSWSESLARAWGSLFVSAGAAGHLNAASGHGPWPEGEHLLEGLLA